jgi:hypothetical protein
MHNHSLNYSLKYYFFSVRIIGAAIVISESISLSKLVNFKTFLAVFKEIE